MTDCLHRLTMMLLLSTVFLNKWLIALPTALKIINNGVRENNQILRDHEKLGLPETLYISRKLPLDRYTLLISCNPK